MSGYLVDTSIFVAAEQRRPVGSAPAQGRRAGAMDAIVAATALAHDLEVWTQDDDFQVLSELAPELRVRWG